MTQVIVQSIMLARRGMSIVISIQHTDGTWQEIANKEIPERDCVFLIIEPRGKP